MIFEAPDGQYHHGGRQRSVGPLVVEMGGVGGGGVPPPKVTLSVEGATLSAGPSGDPCAQRTTRHGPNSGRLCLGIPGVVSRQLHTHDHVPHWCGRGQNVRAVSLFGVTKHRRVGHIPSGPDSRQALRVLGHSQETVDFRMCGRPVLRNRTRRQDERNPVTGQELGLHLEWVGTLSAGSLGDRPPYAYWRAEPPWWYTHT